MGIFSRKRNETQAVFTPVEGEQLFVGEKSYQAALIGLLKGRGHLPESLATCSKPLSESFVAHLVPEPDNSYDSNAVAVHIDGRTVAYLSRANAARYRGAFRSQRTQMAVVLWVKAGGKGIVSVWPDRDAQTRR